MASYGGRRGPNVYSSIANLNTVPSEYEIAVQQQQEGYNMQADLDLFTNAQFFDFDMAEMPNQSPTGFSDNELMLAGGASGLPQQTLNFYDSEFQVPAYSTPSAIPSNARSSMLHSHLVSQQQSTPQHSSTVSSPSSTATSNDKRNHDSLIDSHGTETMEEASRLAAEEDKRRRNTAASARFRVKKKQREAALEKSAKDMTDRLAYLESRVGQLEMENKLLKDLITEKSGKDVDLPSELQKIAKSESNKNVVKKGVGTDEQVVNIKVEVASAFA